MTPADVALSPGILARYRAAPVEVHAEVFRPARGVVEPVHTVVHLMRLLHLAQRGARIVPAEIITGGKGRSGQRRAGDQRDDKTGCELHERSPAIRN